MKKIATGSFFVLFVLCFFIMSGCKSEIDFRLVIEDTFSKEIILEIVLKEEAFLSRHYKHSVYDDDVYDYFIISSDGKMLLVEVQSSPRVLYSEYPGFGLSITEEIQINSNKIALNIPYDSLTCKIGAHRNTELFVDGIKYNLEDLIGEEGYINIYIASY